MYSKRGLNGKGNSLVKLGSLDSMRISGVATNIAVSRRLFVCLFVCFVSLFLLCFTQHQQTCYSTSQRDCHHHLSVHKEPVLASLLHATSFAVDWLVGRHALPHYRGVRCRQAQTARPLLPNHTTNVCSTKRTTSSPSLYFATGIPTILSHHEACTAHQNSDSWAFRGASS